ncbi:MAG: hypothetical protein FWH29_08445 [Methanobrevibacter sp.]|nr:hypothetical protein [Methanobrevibacter sp.]
MDEKPKVTFEEIDEVFQDPIVLMLYLRRRYDKMAEENEKRRTEERIKEEREKGIKEVRERVIKEEREKSIKEIEKVIEEEREKSIKEIEKVIEEEREKSIKEIEKAKIQVAINSKKIGLSLEEIANATGLTMEFIEKL